MAKQQQWVVLATVAVLGVLAAGWFLLVSPQRATAADLDTQTASTQSSAAALRTKVATLQAQAKGLPAQRAKLAEVAGRLPAEQQVPALLRSLTAAAARSGVELVSVAPGTASPVGTAGLSRVPLTVTAFGDFSEVEQYLAELEDLPRALRVDDVSVAPGSNPAAPAGGTATATDDGRSLLATLSGSVFVAPASTTSPDGAAASPAATAVAN